MLIQRRLTLGIGALFAMILLLGIQSVGYILDLSRASGNILTDNYNSLHYARSMMTALDSLTFDSTSMTELLDNLALQRRNITESDEFRVTDNLSSKIDKLSDSVTLDKILEIRSDLYKIMDLNMTAIREKSRLAGTTAEDAMLRIAISAILCALIAFVLLIRFPQAVVRPIRELKKGIMEIANFHYDKRLDLSNALLIEPDLLQISFPAPTHRIVQQHGRKTVGIPAQYAGRPDDGQKANRSGRQQPARTDHRSRPG